VFVNIQGEARELWCRYDVATYQDWERMQGHDAYHSIKIIISA
jgi:hypothetical protein